MLDMYEISIYLSVSLFNQPALFLYFGYKMRWRGKGRGERGEGEKGRRGFGAWCVRCGLEVWVCEFWVSFIGGYVRGRFRLLFSLFFCRCFRVRTGEPALVVPYEFFKPRIFK